MNIESVEEQALVLSDVGAAGLRVPENVSLDSIQLLAAAVASCTWTTLATYGERFGAGANDIRIAVRWSLADQPKRVARMDLDVTWPSLPASRLDAATRAARYCTLHATLTHGAEVETFVDQ
ncbi:MAG: OsmC family protein [Pseudomonadota bacterium]